MDEKLVRRVARRYLRARADSKTRTEFIEKEAYGRVINIADVEADIQMRAPNKDRSFKIGGSWKKYLFDMHGYSVFAVNGSWVRTNLSILFGHGGHGYVHEFIPVDEIWVGTRHWDENEFNNCGCSQSVVSAAVSKEYFLSCVVHEIAECEQMKQGAPYLPSHIKSLKLEKALGLLQDPNKDDGSIPIKST
jgi:hypothetical protein